MSEFKVSYSKEAEKDLDDIYSYIAIEKCENSIAIYLICYSKKYTTEFLFLPKVWKLTLCVF